jgi:hypothetical protein
MSKQLSLEDVIAQMKEMFVTHTTSDPKKIIVPPSQMAVVRQMMDAGAFSNQSPMVKEIYEDDK